MRYPDSSDAQQNKIVTMANKIITFWQCLSLQFHVSIVQSVLWQAHSLFQSEFFTECDLVLHLPYSSIYTFTHSIFERKTSQAHLTNGVNFTEIYEEFISFIFNWCVIWSLNVMHEYGMTPFENMVVWKKYGPNREGCNEAGCHWVLSGFIQSNYLFVLTVVTNNCSHKSINRVVFFPLGDTLASEYYIPTFRNSRSDLSSYAV
jgi:hypothetical protein